MKKKLLLCLLVAVSPFMSFAQGCLTIFSEDGDRFYLVLNGVKQNAAPQTNVRVDGLTAQFYSARILFEDAAKPEITKNIPVTDPGTSTFADVTYKIKRTNSGELKLRYFGATPVPVSYNPPPDMYVVHYGQPAAPSTSASVTQTTYTTTTAEPAAGASFSANGGGVNMSVNVGDPTTRGGGVNMSVNMNDANMTTSSSRTTTTTTTRTTSYGDNGYNQAPPPPPPSNAGGCGYPMDMSSFGEARKAISKASFEETKFSTAKTILGSNCVSTDQVMAICRMFSFEQTKLDFAKFAYPRTTDRGNYFKVGGVFEFDASKTELNDFISQ